VWAAVSMPRIPVQAGPSIGIKVTQGLHWISTLIVKCGNAHARCITEAGGFLPRAAFHRWAIIAGGNDSADEQSPFLPESLMFCASCTGLRNGMLFVLV
jgi:hypothetical protein